jgi:hypothetical protein
MWVALTRWYAAPAVNVNTAPPDDARPAHRRWSRCRARHIVAHLPQLSARPADEGAYGDRGIAVEGVRTPWSSSARGTWRRRARLAGRDRPGCCWQFFTRPALPGQIDTGTSLLTNFVMLVLAMVAIFVVTKITLSGSRTVDVNALRLLALALAVGCIGLSAGRPGDDAAELLRRADIAMYAAKVRGGRAGTFASPRA